MKKLLFLMLVLLLVLAVGLTACGGGSEPEQAAAPTSQGDAAKGEELFLACSACHGANGDAVPAFPKLVDQAISEDSVCKPQCGTYLPR